MPSNNWPDYKATLLSSVDLSPKGSIDSPILPLVTKLNSHPSVATTSSCSGRISIFLDGERTNKGSGGRWIAVAHETVSVEDTMRRLGAEMEGIGDGGAKARLAHFKFEPMILHIRVETLELAQTLLSTVLSAGFRESGIMNTTGHPMLAIRSQGLMLDSIIGFYDEERGIVRKMVSDEYLKILLDLGNNRLIENGQKMEKLGAALEQALWPTKAEATEWEPKEDRAKRMREEGLRKKEELRRMKQEQE